MTATLAAVHDIAAIADITVYEKQIRVSAAEATAALRRVHGSLAVDARARLRFGPGGCEQIARMLDTALIRAENQGLDPEVLVVSSGLAVAAEDIVRVRRKAHGVADFISTATSDVTIVLRPKGLAALGVVEQRDGTADEPATAPVEPESAAELAVREALYEVVDPDLGVNIVDLGFIRRIRVDDNGFATITMTLTSAACPLTMVMESQIAKELGGTETMFAVEWEWMPSWRPADITDDGRDQLRAIGFTAF